MKIWAKTVAWAEGKFLVVRRDGSVPHWPHFVLGARDPYAAATLHFYANHVRQLGGDLEYAESIHDLADDFNAYRIREGDGDPEALPHRKDDPQVIAAMRGKTTMIAVRPDICNAAKAADAAKAAGGCEGEEGVSDPDLSAYVAERDAAFNAGFAEYNILEPPPTGWTEEGLRRLSADLVACGESEYGPDPRDATIARLSAELEPEPREKTIAPLSDDRDRLREVVEYLQSSSKDTISRMSAQVEIARAALAETEDFISSHVSDMEDGQRPHEREYLALAIKCRDRARTVLSRLDAKEPTPASLSAELDAAREALARIDVIIETGKVNHAKVAQKVARAVLKR